MGRMGTRETQIRNAGPTDGGAQRTGLTWFGRSRRTPFLANGRTDGTRAYDIAIVGAGLIGLATGLQILRQRPKARVAIVEKEPELGLHQSSHNSGVLHSGLYYRPGSLKAALCVSGKAQVEQFAERHAIPYSRSGKLIVALSERELPDLARMRANGEANGVKGLREVGPEEIREIEPHANGIRALYSPTTGVIDFYRVAVALGREIRSRGGVLLLDHRVKRIGERPGCYVLMTSRGDVLTRSIVACAGLHADRVAAMTVRRRGLRIVPFRGQYNTLAADARLMVRSMIYPVPRPGLPFLGVHFTRGWTGRSGWGPTPSSPFRGRATAG
jgi:L-2-hydroxyglutarate oxidase LhgO